MRDVCRALIGQSVDESRQPNIEERQTGKCENIPPGLHPHIMFGYSEKEPGSDLSIDVELAALCGWQSGQGKGFSGRVAKTP